MELDDKEKKDIIRLEGGRDMVDLFKYVGRVNDEDSYNASLEKIRKALKGRGNRTAAVLKLFTGMPKGEKSFDA